MKNVVFAISYDIDTDNDDYAIEEATNQFKDDVGIESDSFIKLFGIHVEEADKN